MTNKSYNNNIFSLLPCYKEAVNDAMKKAAYEVSPSREDKPGNIAANVTANFNASLNIVVAAICNGKSADIDVMSKVCNSCQYWLKKKDSSV